MNYPSQINPEAILRSDILSIPFGPTVGRREQTLCTRLTLECEKEKERKGVMKRKARPGKGQDKLEEVEGRDLPGLEMNKKLDTWLDSTKKNDGISYLVVWKGGTVLLQMIAPHIPTKADMGR